MLMGAEPGVRKACDTSHWTPGRVPAVARRDRFVRVGIGGTGGVWRLEADR